MKCLRELLRCKHPTIIASLVSQLFNLHERQHEQSKSVNELENRLTIPHLLLPEHNSLHGEAVEWAG